LRLQSGSGKGDVGKKLETDVPALKRAQTKKRRSSWTTSGRSSTKGILQGLVFSANKKGEGEREVFRIHGGRKKGAEECGNALTFDNEGGRRVRGIIISLNRGKQTPRSAGSPNTDGAFHHLNSGKDRKKEQRRYPQPTYKENEKRMRLIVYYTREIRRKRGRSRWFISRESFGGGRDFNGGGRQRIKGWDLRGKGEPPFLSIRVGSN